MTAFELVFGLITIITSLALTHLLEGFVNLVRNPARVHFSATHALWAWTGFASAVGNWASFWEMRTLKSWPAWAVLLIVATMPTTPSKIASMRKAPRRRQKPQIGEVVSIRLSGRAGGA